MLSLRGAVRGRDLRAGAGGAGGGGGGFDKDTIAGLELWLDAEDADTITGTTDLVSQWDDKSDSGNHVLAAGAQRPSQVTVNSLNAIRFNAAEQLQKASPVACDGPDITIFAVINKQYDEADSWPGVINRSNTGWSTGWRLSSGAADGSEMSFSAAGYITDVVQITSTPTGADAFHLLSADHEDAGGVKNGYLNNVFVGSDTSGLIAGASANAMSVGTADTATAYVLMGSVGEILIYNSVLSAEDRLTVATYLAAKWGITLP